MLFVSLPAPFRNLQDGFRRPSFLSGSFSAVGIFQIGKEEEEGSEREARTNFLHRIRPRFERDEKLEMGLLSLNSECSRYADGDICAFLPIYLAISRKKGRKRERAKN